MCNRLSGQTLQFSGSFHQRPHNHGNRNDPQGRYRTWKRKESYWIEMLRSLAPDGLNLYSWANSAHSRQWDFGRKLIYSVPTFHQGFLTNKYIRPKRSITALELSTASLRRNLTRAKHRCVICVTCITCGKQGITQPPTLYTCLAYKLNPKTVTKTTNATQSVMQHRQIIN